MKPGIQHIIYMSVTMSPVPTLLIYSKIQSVGEYHLMLAHKGLMKKVKSILVKKVHDKMKTVD